MNKLFSLILLVLMPAFAAAHEGHIEGMLSHVLHGFSTMEMALAASSIAIWLVTHKKENRVKKVGAILALGLFGLSIGV